MDLDELARDAKAGRVSTDLVNAWNKGAAANPLVVALEIANLKVAHYFDCQRAGTRVMISILGMIPTGIAWLLLFASEERSLVVFGVVAVFTAILVAVCFVSLVEREKKFVIPKDSNDYHALVFARDYSRLLSMFQMGLIKYPSKDVYLLSPADRVLVAEAYLVMLGKNLAAYDEGEDAPIIIGKGQATKEINDAYDFLKKFDLVPAGGWRSYLKRARKELTAEFEEADQSGGER